MLNTSLFDRDGTRTFQVTNTAASSCAALSGWMMAIDDPSGATTCSFDNTGSSRPYFLYSLYNSTQNHYTPDNSGMYYVLNVQKESFDGGCEGGWGCSIYLVQ